MTPWRTVLQGARRGNVHPATVRRAIKRGLCRAVRVNGGRSIRTRDEWIDEWLERFETAPVVPKRPLLAASQRA